MYSCIDYGPIGGNKTCSLYDIKTYPNLGRYNGDITSKQPANFYSIVTK